MPRPPIERNVAGLPSVIVFKPAGVPARDLDQLQLAVDELEAMRLADREGLSHEQAADLMGVSRQTVGRLLETGRSKVISALVDGKAIVIGGGAYRVTPQWVRCRTCNARWSGRPGETPAHVCPQCGSAEVGVCWGNGGCGGGQRRQGQ